MEGVVVVLLIQFSSNKMCKSMPTTGNHKKKHENYFAIQQKYKNLKS